MTDEPVTTTAAHLAALTETLTRPRFHTHCGETHVPGPCNDGVTRPPATEPLQPWGCKCGNWTDQETCEACGRTLNRTEPEATE